MNSKTFSRHYQDAYPKLVVIASAILQNREEAADVVQQSAVIAIERLDQFQPENTATVPLEFARWMATIVRNVAANTRRRMYIRRAFSLDGPEFTAEENHGGQRTTTSGQDVTYDPHNRSLTGIDDAFDDRLLQALRELSEIQRICLLLKVVLHLTYDEIATIVDSAPGTIASHVSRSKKTLRVSLRDYWESET